MALDSAAFDALLKEDYLDDISDLLNNKIALLHRLERNTQDFEGKRAYQPVHTGRNSGIGARSENGILPTAGAQSHTYAYWTMASLYGTIEVSGQTVALSKSDKGSFARAFDIEVNGCVMDANDDLNRQLFMDGSGILADPTGTSNSATQVVDSIQYLQVNEYVDFVETTDGSFAANGQNRKITAITESSKTLTLDQAVTPTANTKIVRHGNYGLEIYGLDGVIDSANPASIAGVARTYGGINRSTTNSWQANELDASGTSFTSAALSLQHLRAMKNAVDLNSQGELSIIITDYTQHDRYGAILVPDRRFPTANGKPIDLDGGYKALDFDGIPVIRDKYCQPQVMYGLDESKMMVFELEDWNWMDQDGSIFARVPNKDAYGATLYAYKQLGCRMPRAQVKLTNLTA